MRGAADAYVRRRSDRVCADAAARLLRQLRTHREGSAFREEQDRREHLMTELRKARLTGILVAVPVEALEGRRTTNLTCTLSPLRELQKAG